ncbi:hypothetical protein [Streptomyces tendae]
MSFFDVRGLVPRPLHIVIAHAEPDGTPRPTRFDDLVHVVVLWKASTEVIDEVTRSLRPAHLIQVEMRPGTDPAAGAPAAQVSAARTALRYASTSCTACEMAG